MEDQTLYSELLLKQDEIFKNLCTIDTLHPDLLNFIKILNYHQGLFAIKFQTLEECIESTENILDKDYIHIKDLNLLVTDQIKYIIESLDKTKAIIANLIQNNDLNKIKISFLDEKVQTECKNIIHLFKTLESKTDKSVDRIEKSNNNIIKVNDLTLKINSLTVKNDILMEKMNKIERKQKSYILAGALILFFIWALKIKVIF